MAMHSPAPSPQESSVNLIEVIASEDQIMNNVVINGVTNEQGDTKYYISGHRKNTVHIPSRIVELPPPPPPRNVPPCACAVHQMFNKGIEPTLSSDNIPWTKDEGLCFGKKYRPDESPAYSCKEYPGDRSCRRNPFLKDVKRVLKKKELDALKAIEREERMRDDWVPKKKNMYSIADFHPCGDEHGMGLCGGPWGTLNLFSPEELAELERQRKEILRSPPCGEKPGRSVCEGPFGTKIPFPPRQSSKDNTYKMSISEGGLEQLEDEEETDEEEEEQVVEQPPPPKVRPKHRGKTCFASPEMLEATKKVVPKKKKRFIPDPDYPGYDDPWNIFRTAPSKVKKGTDYEKTLKLSAPRQPTSLELHVQSQKSGLRLAAVSSKLSKIAEKSTERIIRKGKSALLTPYERLAKIGKIEKFDRPVKAGKSGKSLTVKIENLSTTTYSKPKLSKLSDKGTARDSKTSDKEATSSATAVKEDTEKTEEPTEEPKEEVKLDKGGKKGSKKQKRLAKTSKVFARCNGNKRWQFKCEQKLKGKTKPKKKLIKRTEPSDKQASIISENEEAQEKSEKGLSVDKPHEKARSVDKPHDKARSVDKPHEKARSVDKPHEKARSVDRPHDKARSVDKPHEKARSVDRPHDKAISKDRSSSATANGKEKKQTSITSGYESVEPISLSIDKPLKKLKSRSLTRQSAKTFSSKEKKKRSKSKPPSRSGSLKKDEHRRRSVEIRRIHPLPEPKSEEEEKKADKMTPERYAQEVMPAILPMDPPAKCHPPPENIPDVVSQHSSPSEEEVKVSARGPCGWRTKSEQALATKKTLVHLAESAFPPEEVPVRPGGRPCLCRENRNKKKVLKYNIGGFADRKKLDGKQVGKLFKKKEDEGNEGRRVIDGVMYFTPPPSPRRSEEYVPEYDVVQSPYDMCLKDRKDAFLKLLERYTLPTGKTPRSLKMQTCGCNDYMDTYGVIGLDQANQGVVALPDGQQNLEFKPSMTFDKLREEMIRAQSPKERWSIALKDVALVDYFTRCQDNVPCWMKCTKYDQAGCPINPPKLVIKKPVCECKYERKIVEQKDQERLWKERQERLRTYKKKAMKNIQDISRPLVPDTKLMISGVQRIPREDEYIDDIKYEITGISENYKMAEPAPVVAINLTTPEVTPAPSVKEIPCMCLHRHWSETNLPPGPLRLQEDIEKEELQKRKEAVDEAFRQIYNPRESDINLNVGYVGCQGKCEPPPIEKKRKSSDRRSRKSKSEDRVREIKVEQGVKEVRDSRTGKKEENGKAERKSSGRKSDEKTDSKTEGTEKVHEVPAADARSSADKRADSKLKDSSADSKVKDSSADRKSKESNVDRKSKDLNVDRKSKDSHADPKSKDSKVDRNIKESSANLKSKSAHAVGKRKKDNVKKDVGQEKPQDSESSFSKTDMRDFKKDPVKVMRHVLKEMAEEGFLFAQLPKSYLMPELNLWLMYRLGDESLHEDKKKSLKTLLGIWNMLCALRQPISVTLDFVRRRYDYNL